MKKYEFTGEVKIVFGITLHRIKAVISFGPIIQGELGGWIEKEENLSQNCNAWVYDNAKVYGNAKVCGNAKVYGNAEVYDNAWVHGDAKVYGNAKVCGNACVCGDAKVYGDADYIVFKNWWSSGRYFTWTRSNNKWRVGCFFGTGAELVAKAYKDSEHSGREYERVVNFVQSILKEE